MKQEEILEVVEIATGSCDDRPNFLRAFNQYRAEGVLYYRFLYELARRLNPRLILETGTKAGHSAAHFAAGCSTATVVTIDVKASAAEAIKALGLSNLRFILGDSRRVAGTVLSCGVDLDVLFLDSAHTYDVVSAEYEIYQPRVKKGGLILLDDIHLNRDLERFWDSLSIDKLEINHLHTEHGAGFGILFP